MYDRLLAILLAVEFVFMCDISSFLIHLLVLFLLRESFVYFLLLDALLSMGSHSYKTFPLLVLFQMLGSCARK